MPDVVRFLAPALQPAGEGSPRWSWRLIALVAIAALGYLVWQGYQQPALMLEFGNLRFC